MKCGEMSKEASAFFIFCGVAKLFCEIYCLVYHVFHTFNEHVEIFFCKSIDGNGGGMLILQSTQPKRLRQVIFEN